MKNFIFDFIVIMEIVGVIALCGIGGGVEQNLMPMSDGILYVGIVGGLMAVGAGVLWFTREKEQF